MKINKIILYLSVYFILNLNVSYAQTFEQWKIDFKILAISKGISASTFDNVMRDVKFLPKVIEYDRYQPEFYEDTKTYISKRTSKKKVLTGLNYYKKNTEKGEFFFYKKPSKKIKSEDVLKDNIPKILESLQWKKSMKWGEHSLYWARPLKSILAI